jgi:outer membrane murein-binding lipoprotein Lpp
MDAQRREAITEWDDRSFSDGFAGLGRVVDDGFSGAATDGTGWLFLVDGRVVGVVDATLDAFADAAGTVYRAPDDALPVLFAMQELGGEPRAKYYTKDTPLREADQKLSQGGFTGYIELSENVLSGDYYVAYTGGESMAAAYVGNARRLETGDDAFELAADEVGIYTVYEVDLDVRTLPDGDDADDSAAAADPTDADAAIGADDEPADEPTDGPADDGTPGEADADGADGGRETTVDTAETGGRDGDSTAPSREDDPAGVGARASADERDDAESSGDPEEPDGPATDAVQIGAAEPDERDTGDSAGDGRTHRPPTDSDGASAPDDGAPDSEDVFSEEAEWREQKSIPALDPSEAGGEPRSAEERRAAASQRSRSGEDRGRADRGGSNANGGSPSPRSTETASGPSAVSKRDGRDARGEADPERVRKLEATLEETETERQSLADERDRLAAERDDVESERDELADEVDRLESEVDELREERDRLRSELSNAKERLPDAERTLTPAEARNGTNLFIRYESKEGATLADAHEGSADREALRENLRVEHHTSFETEGLAVEGRPFAEFLEDTIEYGFTRWLVEDLPFEVRGTGNEGTLRDLYDALPEIDRAEIGGTVSVELREGGEEIREQRSFDLVLRDRMGHPLFVADLNDSRDPTAEGTLESLVENGRDIAASNETFAGAFAVTESFFEPGALETASDAVGGGLFSRSKRASFVKLSRKQGYHLCLVEARDGGFHMTVPDL